MENLKVVELREIARSRGLKGWYRLRKSDLISFIMKKEKEEKYHELDPEEDIKYHKLDPEEEDIKYHKLDPEEEELKPKDIKYHELDPEEKRKAKRRAKKARYRANRRARKESKSLKITRITSKKLEEEKNMELRAKLEEIELNNYFMLKFALYQMRKPKMGIPN